jgi:hypothetical protein
MSEGVSKWTTTLHGTFVALIIWRGEPHMLALAAGSTLLALTPPLSYLANRHRRTGGFSGSAKRP